MREDQIKYLGSYFLLLVSLDSFLPSCTPFFPSSLCLSFFPSLLFSFWNIRMYLNRIQAKELGNCSRSHKMAAHCKIQTVDEEQKPRATYKFDWIIS